MKQLIRSSNVLNTFTWLVLAGCGTITSAKLTKLVRDAKFDGYVCLQNETVFEKTGITEISCARACHQNNGCLSMFYSPLSSVCIGCTRRFTTDDVVETFGGTQYYSRKEQLSQWVQTVSDFSSQDYNTGWSANQVVGPPDVYPIYDAYAFGQWEPVQWDANQFVEVQFEESVYISGVEIYETCNAGVVTAIKALYGGSWTTLWSTTNVENILTVRIFAPTLSVIASPSRNLRIEFNTTDAYDWVGIDAIKLLGIK